MIRLLSLYPIGFLLLFFLVGNSAIVFSQTPCEGGFAEGFPCDRMELLSSMSNADLMGTGANDVCGAGPIPETGVEYALVGERQEVGYG